MISIMQSFIYKAALIFVALSIIYLLVFKDNGKRNIIYLLFITLLTFLIKLPYFTLGDLNPDESEWITIVKTWNVNFNPYINTDPHTTGIIALLPFSLLNKLIPIHYSTIRIVGTLFDLLTIYLTYQILLQHLKQNKKLLFIALAVLYCMLNVSIEPDFIAYNTEHLCILVFTAIVYPFYKMGILFKQDDNDEKQSSIALLFIAGLLIGASLFIKLQNIPAIFFLFCFVSFHFLKNKNYTHLVFLIVFCLLPVFIVLLTLYLKGSLNDFYIRYILTNLDYTSKGLNFAFADKKLYEPFHFKLKNFYPFLTILCLVSLLTITNINKIKKAILNKNLLFFLIILVVTLYEIMQPKNYFQHYYLLLYQPLIPLLIIYKNFEVRKAIFYSILAFQFLFLWVLKSKNTALFLDDPAFDKHLYSKLIPEINSAAGLYNCDNKYIMVWGWNTRYYVYGNFLPVVREVVNIHLFTHTGYLENYYLNSFITDLQQSGLKKILVIDDLLKQTRFKLYKFSEFIYHYHLNIYFRQITKVGHNDNYDTYVIELL
ncbi:MAG: hypothetical protein ABIW34_08825 [Ginsengibacter sp.]